MSNTTHPDRYRAELARLNRTTDREIDAAITPRAGKVSFVTDIATAQRRFRGQYVWEMAGLDRPTGRVIVTLDADDCRHLPLTRGAAVTSTRPGFGKRAG